MPSLPLPFSLSPGLPELVWDLFDGCHGVFPSCMEQVIQCYRKKWVIHVERITREKASGARFCLR